MSVLFKQIGYLSYQWAMVCEYYPFFVLFCFICLSSVVICLFFCLAISYFFMSWIMFVGKPFFWAMLSMFFHSCFFAFSVMDNVIILFMQYVNAASLWSRLNKIKLKKPGLFLPPSS